MRSISNPLRTGSHLCVIFSLLLLSACVATPPAKQNDLGVLVMAHGGSKQWNQDVLAAVKPLEAGHNIDVAFGMADAATLQSSVERLEARGAKRIAVVRLFISGDSFKQETEQILGIAPGAPAKPSASELPIMRATKAIRWRSGKSLPTQPSH
jgi:sirohydrochlorin cobaltochelatase